MTVQSARRGSQLAALAARVDQGDLTPWHTDPAVPNGHLTFYLGAHRPHWLTLNPSVPLFISARQLDRWRTTGDAYPTRKAGTFGCGMWALDSGGFTEIAQHGEWRNWGDEYGGMVTRFIDDIGVPPRFAAIQDWMCEPWVIAGGVHQGRRYHGTGLTVYDHLRYTVDSYLYLAEEFPFIPWKPIIQGMRLDDYLLCEQMYLEAGVNLAEQPVVGLGSVCRRQHTAEAAAIVRSLAARGLRLHGFGFKITGLRAAGHLLASSDSMAWSLAATKNPPLPQCAGKHRNCANCLDYALAWRERVLATLGAAEAA